MRVSAKVAAIEFAGDEVRLAVVKTGSRLPRVLEWYTCRAEYAEPEQRTEALVEAVKTVVSRIKHHPAVYVLCVSSAYSVVRTLTIPFRGARKVAAAVPFELEPYLAFPIEELAVDFTTVLEVEGQTDVLAVGIRRAILLEQLAVLHAAGIDPEGIDVDAVGLTGLWRAAAPPQKGLHAVLHARDAGLILAVVYQRSLVYFRYFSFSADRMREHPVRAVREVQNSLRAFQSSWRGDGEVASLTVTGCGAVPGEDGACVGDMVPEHVREVFNQELDIPVSYVNLLSAVKGPRAVARAVHDADATDEASSPQTSAEVAAPAVQDEVLQAEVAAPPIEDEASDTEDLMLLSEDVSTSDGGAPPVAEDTVLLAEPETATPEPARPTSASTPDLGAGGNSWEAVIGVAMGAAGYGCGLNFRGAAMAAEGPDRQDALRSAIPHIMVTSCLALALLVGVAWFYHHARGVNLALAETLRNDVSTLENDVTKLQEQGISFSHEMFSDPTLLDILKEIAAKMPDERVTVTEIKVDRGETAEGSSARAGGAALPWITIRGQVKDDAMFNKVISDLRESPLFQVDDPERKLDPTGSVFKIVLKRKEAGK